MNKASYTHDEGEFEPTRDQPRRDENKFKKLKRPLHAAKRSNSPERLNGIQRRRQKRMSW
jgi:hypothetical protein